MEFIGPRDSLDILLVGKTGDGKSETANTVLGRATFSTSANTESETKKVQYDWCHFEGTDIKVVDTPGLTDTRLGLRDNVEQLVKAAQIAVVNNPLGYHAILYVIKFGNRFTQEDEWTISTLKVLLGDDFFKDHGVLLITHGDCFSTDPAVIRESISFEDWLNRQDNKNFRRLMIECQNRAVLFDNRTDDTDKRLGQVRKLLGILKILSYNGRRYTNEDFKRVEGKRNELLVSLGKEQEKQNAFDKIGILISKIKMITDNEEGSTKLKSVSSEINEMNMHVTRASVQNRKLGDLKPLLKIMRETLQAKENQVANMIGYLDLMDKLKIKYEQVMKDYQSRQEYLDTKGTKQIEKLLQEIEKEKLKKTNEFKLRREKDSKETEKKIAELERKYILEKNENYEPIRLTLLDFLRSFFSIERFIGLFRRS